MKMQKKIFHILMFLPVPVTLISLEIGRAHV